MAAGALAEGLLKGEDGLVRCGWAGADRDYVAYHDDEWGRPVDDEHRLYEKICLEGFQSGLSWRTILAKRGRFREVFQGFDPRKVARFAEKDVERLLGDAGIVRHRGKIEATIANARAIAALHATGETLAGVLWSFAPPASERPRKLTWGELRKMGSTPASERGSKQLRKLGFRFVGPTTCYAMMQATGIVNDHLEGCAKRDEVEAERARFVRPRARSIA